MTFSLKRLTDPFSIGVLIVYILAVIRLVFIPNALWPALLLGLGVALLSWIVLSITRKYSPQPVRVVRPKTELWSILIWYTGVYLLAFFTYAKGLELVNQFTNWFFLVIVPFGLLVLVRGSGSAMRDTLRSIGLTRVGLKEALKLAMVIGSLVIPILYIIGDKQRAAIQMIFYEPSQAVLSFFVSFLLALLTAGFVEEFFFRGMLQSRLVSSTGSEWYGLLIASLLFGLFHLPLYFFSPFEPTQGNFAWSLSSVITEQVVAGILLGVLWTRTHNLAAPLLIHSLINAFALMTTLDINIGSG